jgi:hypothetical protein
MMPSTFTEGELRFDFSGSIGAERLDEQGVPIPQGMSFVDFTVEEDNRQLLIEIKDPADSMATEDERGNFQRSLAGRELINLELVPKCRDSYTYMHLMKRDSKSFLFVVVLGVPQSFDPGLLIPFVERLRERLMKEAKEPWVQPYVTDCVVMTPDTWSNFFPNYRLQRSRS